MNTQAKKMLYLLLSIMLVTVLVACKNEPTASEVALGYYELITKQNGTTLNELGMPEETSTTIINSMKTSLSKGIEEQLSMNGQIVISEQTASQITDAYLSSLTKLTATVSETKSENGFTITLTSNYIDYPSIDENAIQKALSTIDINTYSNENEYLSNLTSAYINYLIEGYKNAIPSQETVSQTFNFTNQNGLYLPDDYESFTTNLILLITHQK